MQQSFPCPGFQPPPLHPPSVGQTADVPSMMRGWEVSQSVSRTALRGHHHHQLCCRRLRHLRKPSSRTGEGQSQTPLPITLRRLLPLLVLATPNHSSELACIWPPSKQINTHQAYKLHQATPSWVPHFAAHI
ncbi:unnamed protein product [Periconia digitata]|uniref:Uncharacterized protein n=1 Tax=Periconia digitata TaxID=1303443 RepID=A0A9W4U804_9PLEO|nr:unnamed protein product [Periconia digitata]